MRELFNFSKIGPLCESEDFGLEPGVELIC